MASAGQINPAALFNLLRANAPTNGSQTTPTSQQIAGIYQPSPAVAATPRQSNPQTAQPVAPPNVQNPALASSPIVQAMQSGYNPLQPNYAPAPPTVTPTTTSVDTSLASFLGPNGSLSALSPDATIAQIQAGLAPIFQQQNMNQNNALAAAGISGGQAVSADQQLAQQQTAGAAPSLAQAIENSQGLQLSGGENTIANNLNQSQFNANAGNTAAGLNAQNLVNNQTFNTNAANQGGLNLFNALEGAYGGDQSAFNNINNAQMSLADSLYGQILGGYGNLASGQQGNYTVNNANPIASGLSLYTALANSGVFGNGGTARGTVNPTLTYGLTQP